MSVEEFARDVFYFALDLSLLVLGIAFLLVVARIWKGPTLPDRVLGLDMLVGIAIGFIAVIGLDTGYTLYVDIAIALGLVGFLATVAFARFILARGKTPEGDRPEDLPFDDDVPEAAGGRATAEGAR